MDTVTRAILDCFEQINRIPRCSKQEQRISQWLQQWAADRNLATKVDPAGNLVIRVPASPGFEPAPVVILQGHMDMVCEKRADSKHDFTRDPIRMVQDGPWLTARETTLGADNGIAIAMALVLVEHPDVSHPPLELLFTVDEETGLTGALQMDPSLLTGRILINLDSEDEGVFVVGCAGGRATIFQRALDVQPIGANHERLQIRALGMRGGHSGVDIAKHRANANKIMARLLSTMLSKGPLRLVDLNGGTGRNVIPRECAARLACRKDQVALMEAAALAGAEIIRKEYRATEPDLTIVVDREGAVDAGCPGVTEAHTMVAVNLLMALPSGPVEMAVEFPLLVQTSVNLAQAKVDAATLEVVSSQRSSVPSRLDALCRAVEAVGHLAGAGVETTAGYPSWPMNRESRLLQRCKDLYLQLFSVEPTVQIMHAGLECGVIGDRCPGMDMISLGPTMENPHSPSERLYLPSVDKVWRLLVALLASFKA